MDFEQIIKEANETADKRKKAYSDLKKSAPYFFKAYANAMTGLGYKSTNWHVKLFHNQSEYQTQEMIMESSIKFNFQELTLTEATEEVFEEGYFKNRYDGEVYNLDFSKNTDGEVLRILLEKLPKSLERCIAVQKEKIEKVKPFIL